MIRPRPHYVFWACPKFDHVIHVHGDHYHVLISFYCLSTTFYKVLTASTQFLSRVSILTTDARYWYSNLSVRLSVRPLRSGIRWKRLNISSYFFFTVRQPNHSSFTSIKHLHEIPTESPPTGAINKGGYIISGFSTNKSLYLTDDTR